MGILYNASLSMYRKKSSDIVLEADDDVIDLTEDNNGTDYTAEADKNIDESDSDDKSDTEDDDDDASQETDNPGEPPEATDYTADADAGLDSPDNEGSNNSETDSGTNDSTDSESNEQSPDDKRNMALIDDMTALYYSVKSTLSKLDGCTQIDMIANKVIVQVKKNFADLMTAVYEYIINNFKGETYGKNLYMYNSFIEAYRINIEMLKKISVL